jgi:small subunit ribosomal protein S21
MSEKQYSYRNNQHNSKGGESYNKNLDELAEKAGPGPAFEGKPLEVAVYGNNFDRALRAFRALVQKERILSLYKEKSTYEKPSDKKRRKRSEAIRKNLEFEGEGEFKPRMRKRPPEPIDEPTE